MQFNFSNIKLSCFDKIKGLQFPKQLSEDLIELIGFHLGDGYCGINKRYNGPEYRIEYWGNMNTELDYYTNILPTWLKQLFNIKVKVWMYKDKNVCVIRIFSKGLALFYNQSLKIPLGNKCSILRVPEYIWKCDKRFKASFLRGLFDADGYIGFKNRGGYRQPAVSFTSKSREFRDEIAELLKEFGFSPCVCNRVCLDKRNNKYYKKHEIHLQGKANYTRWMNSIGTRHIRHR